MAALRYSRRMHIDVAPFLVLSTLVILLPGPDTAVVTKHALVGGRRGGISASVGVTIGLSVWTLAAAVGIATLLRASEVAFLTLRIAGAIYLVWIGIQLLRNPGRTVTQGDPAVSRKALRQGLLSDLGNPKVAIFFTSFLPQFVHADSAGFLSLLLLGGTFTILTFLWLLFYSALVGHGASILRRPRIRRVLDRVTGLVLVGFGVRLATSR